MLSLKLDMTRNVFLKDAVNEDVLTLVSHLGTGENSTMLSRRRLKMLSSYLVRMGLRESQVVLATGYPVTGLGHVDAFHHGRLIDSFTFSKNKNGQAGNCDGY